MQHTNSILKVFVGLFFLLNAITGQAQLRCVVLDAGHGGHDPGAVGKLFKEKDIALSIAKKVGQLLEADFPEMKVVYTRKTDAFVELHKRAAKANAVNADLFISIHVNAMERKNSHIEGTEVFVMGAHVKDENLRVAKLENKAILLEKDYKKHYDGFDPNSPEGNIAMNMVQNAYLDHSLNLASMVSDSFKKRAKRTNRGVHSAGFMVLKTATMPSILIECGYISNPEEELFLGSEEGQNKLAESIFFAIRKYQVSVIKTMKMAD